MRGSHFLKAQIVVAATTLTGTSAVFAQSTDSAAPAQAVTETATGHKHRTVFLDTICPGEEELNKAETLFRERNFAEAKVFFELAISKSDSSGDKLDHAQLGGAKHALGHILGYLCEGDHGEKYFAEAMKEYEKINWSTIPMLGASVVSGAALNRFANGDKTRIAIYRSQADFTVIRQTNYDWSSSI